MKPSKIFDVLDLARNVAKNGGLLHPMFVGAPGIAKSENVKRWTHDNGLRLIDLRGAYLEAPDVIGYPSITLKDGRQITVHNIPEFWPNADLEQEGVLFVDEINRSTTAVMNVFMQLLTDKKIHTHEFPKKWLIVSAINPENAEHDVNTMDAALKNRFVMFHIDYDKEDFIQHMKKTDFNETVRLFVESGAWSYTPPENVGNMPGNKYTSPRTIKQLDDAVKANIPEFLKLDVYEAILGSTYGKAFYAFSNGQQPVLFRDLVENERHSLMKLEKFSDPNDYKNGHIEITIRDIVENESIDDKLLCKVLTTLPADRSYVLLRELEFKRKDRTLTDRIMNSFKEVREYLKSNLKDAVK